MAFTRFHADIRCPECESSDLARSQRGNKLERLLSNFARFWPLRCLDCQNRWFVFSRHDPKDLLRARIKSNH